MSHPRLEWLPDPAVLAPIALLVGVYAWRFRQARQEAGGRGAGARQAVCFAIGIAALLAALATPIDGLGGDYLFSAHMLQHVLIGDIAAVFLLLGLSRVILRPVTRRLIGVERALGPFAMPLTGLFVWLALMYLWHVPALYDAALRQPPLHALEHAAFFAAGIALWWPLVQPIPMRRALTGLWPVAYLAAAKAGLAALGLYLTWSTTVLYDYYETVPRIWGLSPIEDQNVGGAIMMVEQSISLVIALSLLFVASLTRSEEEQLRRERLEDAAHA